MAANHLVGGLLENSELIKIGTEMEGHPDNVGTAMFGGFASLWYMKIGLFIKLFLCLWLVLWSDNWILSKD